MNKVRVYKLKDIVEGMTIEEVTKEIKDLELALTTQNVMVKYNLDNNIELSNYIHKTNAISDMLQTLRMAAHEKGKLERALYA